MRIRTRKARKVVSGLLAVFLVFSSIPPVYGANHLSHLLTSVDFENGDTGGFIEEGASTSIESDDGANHYLKLTGKDSGTSAIVKTLAEPAADAQIQFHFDWKPNDMLSPENSSEVLFSDSHNNPLFRLVKAGGASGAIMYGVGTTGTDLSTTLPVTGVSTDQGWLSVNVNFDTRNKTVSMSVYDKEGSSNYFASSFLDISSFDNGNSSVAKMSVIGNNVSGNNEVVTAGLDNLEIYEAKESVPSESGNAIVSIVTEYTDEITVPKGVAIEDVVTFLPGTVEVELDNNVRVEGIEVNWDSADYDPNQSGVYSFTGTLVNGEIPNVSNDNNIKAASTVNVAETSVAPVIEGFTSVYYSDFGDTTAPTNWGFTTASATLSSHTSDLAGNSTPKLQFSVVNQSGGRVASKSFDTPVKGDKILVAFDWYPGKISDKGINNANENSGEFRINDSSNNTIFTLNHTNKAPLSFYVGGQSGTAVMTGMTNSETWYNVNITFDLASNEATLLLTDVAAERSETHTISIEDIKFDGSVEAVKLGGVRTSGNNLNWTSYLDNLGIYNVSIKANTITRVDNLPYYRVYVNEKTDAIDSIGLPNQVTVTLADNSKVDVAVSEWNTVGDTWNAAKAGVFEFQGTLAVTEDLSNSYNRSATMYVYNRLSPPVSVRQTEWLDRGVIALNSDDGVFVSWRLLADELNQDVSFHIYRNGEKLTTEPLTVTNFADSGGKPGDTYRIETLVKGKRTEKNEVVAAGTDYLSIPMQKPEGGTTASGSYTYSVNDASVGDLDGDGKYEVIVKWYPSNAIDSSQRAMTGPTIFDAYKLDGTLLWRMNMGLNLTSGAHYNQFIVADFDGNGKSEVLIKTADATTVYGTTNGIYDSEKVISVIGNAEDNGKWVNDGGHVYGGPEYMSIFNGETGQVIDTVNYAFPLGEVGSWGDTWHNRSDRFLAGLAYLDGVKPSAVFGRGYYERTTYVAYSLVSGKLQENWTFDSTEEGTGGGLGFHSLATGDVDNDGFDEIIAGSLTLDHDGKILYAMDGEQGREKGSHGDALHVGAFDPDREGLHVISVHEDPAVASLEYHDGATGETIMSFNAYVDAGRGLAANITTNPGYEFWGAAGRDVTTGGGIYNVKGDVIADSYRDIGLPVNFALYWDGDLLQELLDKTSITKYNEKTATAGVIRTFADVVSSNGTKATPTLQADILGDWREEVLLPTTDSSELRIFSTTIPTEYRLYTLMHDTVYRMGIAWQNTAYNQPPHLGFYLGEDIREDILSGSIQAPNVVYTNKPFTEDGGTTDPGDTGGSANSGNSGNSEGSGSGGTEISIPNVIIRADGAAAIKLAGKFDTSTSQIEAAVTKELFSKLLMKAQADVNGTKQLIVDLTDKGQAYRVRLPVDAIQSEAGQHQLTITSEFGDIILPSNLLEKENLKESDVIEIMFAHVDPINSSDKKVVEVKLLINGTPAEWKRSNPIKISIPYTPTTEEAKEHEHLTVMRVDEKGNRNFVYNGRFNPTTSRIDFKINQSTKYAVSFVHKTFSDLQHVSWAQKEIEVLASKGIVEGTSVMNFSPEIQISRADFLVLLVRALELDADIDGNFKDVEADDYYYNAVGIAKKLGIANGQGTNLFQPQELISRQDMMVLAKRAVDSAKIKLPMTNSKKIESYLDQGEITDYALDSVTSWVENGFIVGHNEKINPKGFTTRAEATVFMYRIFQLSEY
ncbi:hypothetical protein J45TS6_13860 [Paenibacillus sp. J45TS6]|uniref:rhamnogalacturonan lyase family protein n=1 Tax=Paenibacillus sp. J45TS6 TaxID=2807196 RepID=UPI001B1BBE1F|nr:S-layer homology domain-containing protein [Paenibacillus sp. J45TS6]GIP42927.1 hypothetical protein J45TS6_13860 [Paenibacillus sp. J45TS6]